MLECRSYAKQRKLSLSRGWMYSLRSKFVETGYVALSILSVSVVCNSNCNVRISFLTLRSLFDFRLLMLFFNFIFNFRWFFRGDYKNLTKPVLTKPCEPDIIDQLVDPEPLDWTRLRRNCSRWILHETSGWYVLHHQTGRKLHRIWIRHRHW